MIRMLPEMPELVGDFYAPVMPRWFNNVLRFSLLSFGLAVAFLLLKGFDHMNVLEKVLLTILPVAFLFMAIHPRGLTGLSKTPFFLADIKGMYLRHRMAEGLEVGHLAEIENTKRKSWIFIPWTAISNIRVEKVSMGDDGYGSYSVVFDLKGINRRDVEPFLLSIFHEHPPDFSAAFYCSILPFPSNVAATLQYVMSKSKC